MNGNMLLESGKIFRGSGVSSIGGKVVDDSRNITVAVVGEGKASITFVEAQDVFTPGVQFKIYVTSKNIGSFADELFVKLTNIDTGEVLKNLVCPYPVEPGDAYAQELLVTLTQITDFHGLIEAGHEE